MNMIDMKPRKELKFPVLKEIETRWSGRSFADQELNKETLLQVLEAARWAPSSYNEQPWKFVVGKKGSNIFDKLYSTLSPMNQVWAKNAGALILVLTRTTLERNDKPNKYAWYDTGASVAFLSIEAERLGLNVHQMGGFDHQAAKELFKVEEPFEVVSSIAIGHRGEPQNLSEDLKNRELAPQRRKEMEKISSFEL